MAGDHVDVGTKSKNNVDSVFNLFSDLTGEKNENPRYCLTLIKTLRTLKFNVGSGSNLEYSVKRLVRGLCSARLNTQCGCFAALACVLKYQACLVETVLEVLEKEQNPAPGATKCEVKSLVTGCVLACGAIIHSGLFTSQSKEVQESVLKKLIKSGKKKSYLLPVICQFLIDVVNSVDDRQFKNIVWPICKSELFNSFNDCGTDVFNLLLACSKKNQKIVNGFLQKNFMSPYSLVQSIANWLFSNSVKCDHPIYDNLGQFFCTDAASVVEFWPKCVDENAKISSHKDTVLIILFSCIIRNLQEASVVPKLLVPKFLETLMRVLSLKKAKRQKDDSSSKIAKDALNSMITLLCSERTSDETRFQSIKKLLFYPANLKFEMKTGTKCIFTLISQLSYEFIKKLADIYKQVISGEVEKKIDEDGTEENWNIREKQYALHVLTKILNHPSLKKETCWKLCQVKFIFEIGFLKKFQLSSEVQKCAKDCFFKVIMVQMASLKELVLFLDDLSLYINGNIKNKDLVVSREVETLWDKMYSVLEKLKMESNNKLFTSVHILLIYMGLYLFVDYDLAKGGIEELLCCYQRLKETGRAKRKLQDENTPHWTEVTVDLILSLLSRENRLWRHVVSCVFPQVVSQITPTALQQIIDALDPKSQSDLLRHIDSDDSETESEENSDSNLSESEESSLEEADDAGKPNDQLRLAVRNALGYSAAHTDDESIDMDQMNEEEERRLNESLSAAFGQFKSKSRAKKNKQTKEEEALTHFRLRVLDLIEIYITNSPSMGGCLDLLLPLFDLLELSIKDHNQRPLQNRVDSIIKHVSAVKVFSNTENVNQAIIRNIFHSLIDRKETSALVFVEMSPRISECTAYLVRCSQQVPSDDAEIPLVDEYEQLLKAFFQSRDSKFPVSAFQSVLRLSWRGNFKIVATLFQLLVSPTVRIFKKLKIIELLTVFYKNDKLHSSCDENSKSELKKIEIEFICNFINLLSDYKKNESKTTEKMYLSFFSNVIVLIKVVRSFCKKHGAEKYSKKISPWRDLVAKMVEVELIVSNKRTRSQLGNLAVDFEVELPFSENVKKKRRISERSDQVNEEEKEKPRERDRKKKKKLSAETRKLKEESRKLREEMSANGLTLFRFSAIDSDRFPEPEEEEEEDDDDDEGKGKEMQEESKTPKKKRKNALNGF